MKEPMDLNGPCEDPTWQWKKERLIHCQSVLNVARWFQASASPRYIPCSLTLLGEGARGPECAIY